MHFFTFTLVHMYRNYSKFQTPYVFGHPLFFTEIINFAYLMFRTNENFGYFPFPLFSDTYIFWPVFV